MMIVQKLRLGLEQCGIRLDELCKCLEDCRQGVLKTSILPTLASLRLIYVEIHKMVCQCHSSLTSF